MLRTVLKFSKCGSVSSDGIPACLSKWILFLLSRCQSSFLVSSLNAPLKLCQACFLSSHLFFVVFFLPQDLALCRLVCSESEMETLAKHPAAGTRGLSFYQRYPCHRRPAAASARVLGWHLQDSGGIRFQLVGSDWDWPASQPSAPGTGALDRSRSVPRL